MDLGSNLLQYKTINTDFKILKIAFSQLMNKAEICNTDINNTSNVTRFFFGSSCEIREKHFPVI
jgi:hypothetical protein